MTQDNRADVQAILRARGVLVNFRTGDYAGSAGV
jgi:hypothetical protein